MKIQNRQNYLERPYIIPIQNGVCSAISNIVSRAMSWIRDIFSRCCSSCKKPQLNITNVPMPQPLPSPIEPRNNPQVPELNPIFRHYNIVTEPNPRPFVFQPRPFPLGDRYPLIREHLEGRIEFYGFLQNGRGGWEWLEEACRRGFDEAPIVRGMMRGQAGDDEVVAASLGLQHDLRGLRQRPSNLAPINEDVLAQINIDDLLSYLNRNFGEVFPEGDRNQLMPQLQNICERLIHSDDLFIQKSVRILIHLLNRPDFNNHKLAKIVLQEMLRLDNLRPELWRDKLEKLASYVKNAGGPVFPGWGIIEGMLYHKILKWNTAKKERVLSPHVNFIDHARHLVGESWGLNFPERQPVNNRRPPEYYSQHLEDLYTPCVQVSDIKQKLQERFLINGHLNGNSLYGGGLIELCCRLMGEQAAKSFINIVANPSDPYSFFNLEAAARNDPEWREQVDDVYARPKANYAAFILEHMGFLTRQNQNQPQPDPAPVQPVALSQDFRDTVLGENRDGLQTRLDELRSCINPLQTCLADPRWSGVRPIFERAIELNQLKIAFTEERMRAIQQ